MVRKVLFSERCGVTAAVGFQVKSMTPELKNRLWSVVYKTYWGGMETKKNNSRYYTSCSGDMLVKVWDRFHKLSIDDMSMYSNDACNDLKRLYGRLEWWGVYNYIEFISCSDKSSVLFLAADYDKRRKQFQIDCNEVLEDEMSAYRFVDGVITPIVDDVSITSIEDAIKTSSSGASEHMKKALELYSQRPIADYRNSVKESISAVEALAKNIANDSKANTLGKALDEMKKRGIAIDSSLVAGIKSIFGWTSNEGGIRHGMANLEIVGEEDARMMLVACSAFVNYLTAKGQSAG